MKTIKGRIYEDNGKWYEDYETDNGEKFIHIPISKEETERLNALRKILEQ